VAADHHRVNGGTLATPTIIAAADAGDAAARATRARLVSRAARSLASVINLLDPDVIVLGGGLSNVPRLAEDITAALPAWVFSDTVHTPLVRHRHGDASGVRGAAWLWPAA
jgi:fructokinase